VGQGTEGRRALITGLTGQDGSWLAELLLGKGYQVMGMVRSDAVEGLGASEHLRSSVDLVCGDLLDQASLRAAVIDAHPDELYHLAAPSFMPDSWRDPALVLRAVAGATATLLEAVRDHSPHTRVFVAASAQIFGAARTSPQREDTPARPENPYASAKLAAHRLVGHMRSQEGLFACSGILYNHESERRPERFVSRKVTRAAAAIRLGLAGEVVLGDLDAVRDWSFAGDIAQGAWLMLQHQEPDDYILASGIPHTVRELAEIAFAHVGLDAGDHVRIDRSLARAVEPVALVGDSTRARRRLGWRPTLSFEQLVQRMVDADLRDQDGSLR
jgi:GDPmannose 4,6-dehydratase